MALPLAGGAVIARVRCPRCGGRIRDLVTGRMCVVLGCDWEQWDREPEEGERWGQRSEWEQELKQADDAERARNYRVGGW